MNMKAQDNVGIGKLVRTASNDRSSLTATRRSSTSLPRAELTKELMEFGALIHGLMVELFPRNAVGHQNPFTYNSRICRLFPLMI